MNPMELALRKGLPVDVGYERMILGAVIRNAADNLNVAAEILRPDDFSVEGHRVLFEHLLRMAEGGEKIDRGTVGRSLLAVEKLEVAGGIGYLVSLDDELPEIYHLDAYCESIQRKSVLRRAITAAHVGVAQLCEPGATLDDLERFKGAIAAIDDESKARRSGFRHISEIVANEDGGGVQAFLSPPALLTGVPWPWQGLTRMIGPMAPGQVICVSAPTGVGKTTLMTQTALHGADLGHCAAILTLEMTATEQAKKLIAQYGQICLSNWLRGESDKSERKRIALAAHEMQKKPLYFDDRDDVTPVMLRAAIERMKVPPVIVGIDYAQLMDSGIRDKGTNREQHVAHISRSLKKMAKRYSATFLVLSQLSEEGKTRESRALEHDATFHVKLERKPGGIYRMSCPKARFAAYGHHIDLRLDGEVGLFTEVESE